MNEYQIKLFNAENIIEKLTNTIRIFYMIRGTGNGVQKGIAFPIRQNDIFLVNSEEPCSVHLNRGSSMVMMEIDYYGLCSEMGIDKIGFSLNNELDTGYKYIKFISSFQTFLLHYSGNQGDKTYEVLGEYYLLLNYLVENFGIEQEKEKSLEEKTDENRANRMLAYIHSHFRDKVSLEEISGKIYLSTSAASRLFLRVTGEHFNTYVKKFRLAHVTEDLRYTNLPITAIAVNNGFSTASVLNRTFRVTYGMSPLEYRKKYQVLNVQTQEEKKKVLYQILSEKQEVDDVNRKEKIIVKADIRKPKEKTENEFMFLVAGSFYRMREANMQKQILIAAREMGVSYIRMWSPFSTQMMVVPENGRFNFSFLDEVLDFCVDNQLNVFIDMGQRKDVAFANENSSIYDEDTVYQFQNEADWLRLLESFLQHIVQRYRYEVVRKWIFEFSFFLNDKPYYLADRYSPHRAWEKNYEIVKKWIPDAKVAGPGLPGTSKEATEMLIESFLDSRYQPDIFTLISFPYRRKSNVLENMRIDQPDFRKVTENDFVKRQLTDVRATLKKYQYNGRVILTEWGISVGNRNYLQDSCFRGAFILYSTLEIYDLVDGIGMFFVSDLQNTYSDTYTVLSGAGGLMTRNGVKKPAYFAFSFLNSLGRMILQKTENSIVTEENENSLQILCFNNKSLGPNYFMLEENAYRPEEISQLFIDKERQTIHFEIRVEGENTEYRIEQKFLNQQHGSVLSKWIQMHCDNDLSREEIQYLRNTSIPTIQIQKIRSEHYMLKFDVELEPNEVRLIMIRKK